MCTRPIKLMRINRDCSTLVRRRPNWSVIAGAATVAVGFVAGMAALDAAPISNDAIRSVPSSSVSALKPATSGLAFPKANRVAKRDRLRVPTPDDQRSVEIKRDLKDDDSSLLRSAPHETETKTLTHCEPVLSPLAGLAVRKMPLRSCLAWLGTPPQYALLGLAGLRIS
jgi:hypothetical protein